MLPGEGVMALTNEQVEHVALLARLGLSDAERERMREQLSSILDHIDQLRAVDTSNVAPTAQVIPLDPILRDDEVQDQLTVEQVLANTPRSEHGYIKVKAILEQE
jgi:aspartyl-tRNA(Asn)/glutamyl-tRNA(Gln) amidotransferase subunit C